MEYENKYASKGVAGAGLGLGIAGTALGLMAGGLNGTGLFGTNNNNCTKGTNNHGDDLVAGAAMGLMTGLLGSNSRGTCTCNEDHYVNRYEATQNAKIAELETEVKLRDSNIYTDGKILELYKYVDGKFTAVDAALAQQAVYNATNTATVNCLAGQVAQLQSLTKTIIPITNVCPEPLKLYNSWTAPTAPTTGA